MLAFGRGQEDVIINICSSSVRNRAEKPDNSQTKQEYTKYGS